MFESGRNLMQRFGMTCGPPGLALTPVEQLMHLRRTLGISLTDLAELLGESRPTTYAWLQGAEPTVEQLDHLSRLVRLANDIDAYGLGKLGALLKRPLRDGTTVLTLIKGGHPIAPAMKELEIVMRRERQQRALLKGSRNIVTAAEATMEQSVPGYLSGTPCPPSTCTALHRRCSPC